jgi:hypothetical protein
LPRLDWQWPPIAHHSADIMGGAGAGRIARHRLRLAGQRLAAGVQNHDSQVPGGNWAVTKI